MNAFTQKPNTDWLKKADLNRRISQISTKKLNKPTPTQAAQLGLDVKARRIKK